MLLTLVVVLASAATMARGQYTPTINPDSVILSERETWCNAQVSSCPILCLQMPNTSGARVNSCSPNTLSYVCECSNGLSPNSSQYSQTMPYFICTEANNQCVAKCADAMCQSACRSDHPCGAQDPVRVNITAIPSATSSGKVAANTTTPAVLGSFTATGDANGPLSGDMRHVYGLCVLVGGFVVGFAALM
ncbi:uncharacterized protein N7484_010580 [Penicillium longicatenatum]|uniref:uncharacterized protein n=1 Tax=Penicillium longicatenatum TaxID=1561947 RepID=UPI0025487CD6|nr:uncharacterized protein N7484_010580 [Penicillium longicatenatum]KAJ5630480.1 hypothetical protein N7484_010580 [Penicillium longicatenatum]